MKQAEKRPDVKTGVANRDWIMRRMSIRRGDGAAERAGLENRSPGNWTASSNLAPSANQSGPEINILCFSEMHEVGWKGDTSPT